MERYRRTFSRTIPTGDRADLRIENRNGQTRVRAHDGDDVVINVAAEFWAESAEEAEREMERIAAGITAQGETIEVRAPEHEWSPFQLFGWPGFRRHVHAGGVAVDVEVGDGGVDLDVDVWHATVDYDISAPTNTSLKASARNGHIEVSGLRGPVEAETRNGHVAVADAARDVTAATRNGHITLARCGAAASANSRNGRIGIESAEGPVAVETRNGMVEISDAGAAVRASTHNGALRYRGAVRGDFSLETSNGSVMLTVPADSRFEIDAESRHGSVRSDLTVREQAVGANGARPKVHIRTGFGSIRIREA